MQYPNLPSPKIHFTDISCFNALQLRQIIELAKDAKQNKVKYSKALDGKVLCSIFQKLSTRTRLSFDIAINQLGGRCIVLNAGDIHLGKNESIKDTALLLSRMADFVSIRCYAHDDLMELAKYSSVPVINALTDYSHPCQIIASVMAIEQKLGSNIDGKTIAWVGDGNNVLTSYIHLAAKFNFTLNIATPKGYEPNSQALSHALANGQNGAKINLTNNPQQAVKGADVVVTDTWLSMGQEGDLEKIKSFNGFIVDSKLMSLAKQGALFTHCLPAHRGYEVSDDVIDSKLSIVFDEAENRIYAQKAILLFCEGLTS